MRRNDKLIRFRTCSDAEIYIFQLELYSGEQNNGKLDE